MAEYGLKNKVALVTGVNNPQGIGAVTSLAFAREGAKLVLVYKKVFRPFDNTKTAQNGVDRYYAANAGNADNLEHQLQALGVDYLILESDISEEAEVRKIYSKAIERFGKVDILVNNAATDDESGLDTIEKHEAEGKHGNDEAHDCCHSEGSRGERGDTFNSKIKQAPETPIAFACHTVLTIEHQLFLLVAYPAEHTFCVSFVLA